MPDGTLGEIIDVPSMINETTELAENEQACPRNLPEQRAHAVPRYGGRANAIVVEPETDTAPWVVAAMACAAPADINDRRIGVFLPDPKDPRRAICICGGRAPDHTGRTFPYRAANAAGSETARNARAARR